MMSDGLTDAELRRVAFLEAVDADGERLAIGPVFIESDGAFLPDFASEHALHRMVEARLLDADGALIGTLPARREHGLH